ncbi:AraC family transcriptional regulator [Roseibium sp.]|uniref:helix-turn-helix transcriptional regulator n=1 Tax=Roseibium sp. TaxID=1936156 RepID=UPI003D115972
MLAPYRTTFNGKLDRLSSLIDRLRVDVSFAAVDDTGVGDSNFRIYSDQDRALRLVFYPGNENGSADLATIAAEPNEKTLVAARISVSGIGKQLINALPRCISVPLAQEPFLTAVADPLIEEAAHPRCGGQAAFQRLCEVVVIRLLRRAMEEGTADAGLLNGLAHPRIAAALVAIHEAPGEAWTLERLADTAGMSRTQFAVTFRDVVGVTPIGYLASWRLEIARSELEAGQQVKSVATLCGFSSPAAFSRAFSKRFGAPPKQARIEPRWLET